eukprot:TRINITY_DN2677_c0_g2_i6.p2 TRINITY_DN2677_c0_g2~~TRINITY_DN2677_c0_g2_i6.p2  ORF type:complete len:218 (-),score=60.92 TRINITY_DN2677_c0_g2_i6:749-1402(-)
MIQCEECDEWYHVTCMGLSLEEANKMATYVCRLCFGESTLPAPRTMHTASSPSQSSSSSSSSPSSSSASSSSSHSAPAARTQSSVTITHAASPDGLVGVVDQPGAAVLEVKCPFAASSQTKLLHSLPIYYYLQVQHQMFVTGRHLAYFVVFVKTKASRRMCVYQIKYDTVFMNEVERCVVAVLSRGAVLDPAERRDLGKKFDVSWKASMVRQDVFSC